jgi:ABC-type sugar transport system permease subunit
MSDATLSAADRRRPWLLLAPSLVALVVLMVLPIGIM